MLAVAGVAGNILRSTVGALRVPRASLSKPLPAPRPSQKGCLEVDLVTTIRIRVLGLLTRRGIIEDSDEQLVLLPDDRAETEPVLAQLTGAAASGLPLAGPEHRERELMRLARTQATISGALPIDPPSSEVPAAGNACKARSTWRPWRELLKRSFDIDIQCSKCGGPLQLKAFLIRPQSLRRLLETLGEPVTPPQRAPPRPPPYFTSRTARKHHRHHEGSDPQTVLFDSSGTHAAHRS